MIEQDVNGRVIFEDVRLTLGSIHQQVNARRMHVIVRSADNYIIDSFDLVQAQRGATWEPRTQCIDGDVTARRERIAAWWTAQEAQ